MSETRSWVGLGLFRTRVSLCIVVVGSSNSSGGVCDQNLLGVTLLATADDGTDLGRPDCVAG